MNKFALLFPGQGTQFAGMGHQLVQQEPIARVVYEEVDEALGFSLSSISFGGDETLLMQTQYAQPAILAYSVSLYRVLQERWHFRPYCAAGHSLGEYSALCCSGALSLADAASIVYQRGKLMQETEKTSSNMAAVLDIDQIALEELCLEISTETEVVVIGAINSFQQLTISGHRHAVEEAVQRIGQIGGRAVPLRTSGAFHSPLMDTAAVKLREVLRKQRFGRMSWPTLSNITGQPHHPAEIVDRLVEQMTKPVQWLACMNYLETRGVKQVLELGPGKVLSKLVDQEFIHVLSCDPEDNFAELEKEWTPAENRMGLLGGSLALAVSLKNSNWDTSQYRTGVIEPYQRIKSLYTELEKGHQQPTLQQLEEALEMLDSVIRTKMFDLDEGSRRVDELLHATGTKTLLKHKYVNF